MLQRVTALKQHRDNVVNLRGLWQLSKHQTSTQCWVNVGPPSKWANINTTTGRHVNWGSASHIKEIQLKLIGHLVQVNIVITRSLGSNESNRVISESRYTIRSLQIYNTISMKYYYTAL